MPLLPRAPAFLRLAAAVMVTVLALAGIAFGSARAMPGGALYGLKRGIEDVNVSLAANDVARDRAKLDAAKARMSELQQLRHEGRLGAALTPQTAHRVAGLLQDWANSAVSGATDLLHRPDPGARLELNHFVSQQSALLAALRPLLPAADLQRLGGGAAAFLGQLQPAVAPAAPASPGRLPRSAPIPLRPASTRPPTRQVAGAAASARGVASAGSHASSLPVPAPAGTYAGGQRAAHTAPTDAAPPVTVPPVTAPTNAAPPVAVPPGTTPPPQLPPPQPRPLQPHPPHPHERPHQELRRRSRTLTRPQSRTRRDRAGSRSASVVAMVVVMRSGCSVAEVNVVIGAVEDAGGSAFVSRGVARTIIGVVGDDDVLANLNLTAVPAVAEVIRVTQPYKLVSREHHAGRSTVVVGSGELAVPIGPDDFALVAGPCAVETPEQTLEAAQMAKRAGARLLRGGAYKPRTSPYAFQGLGEKGLRILSEVRAEVGMAVVTEVVDAHDVDVVAEHADMLQVGTRNMSNFTLLQAVGGAGKPVLLKRGMTATYEEWLMAAEYVAQRGNLDIVLCERGIRTFETATRNTLDISSVPMVRALSHLPVMVDPSHAAGRRDLVVPLSRAAIAAGADGLLVDVHPHPELALCDGPQALREEELVELSEACRVLTGALGRRG